MTENGTLAEKENFLKTLPPFNLLPENGLQLLVSSLIERTYPRGEIILSPEGPPNRHLYLIRRGGVKFLIPGQSRGGSERLVDIRGERQLFGVFSLWSDRPSPFTIIAEQDTQCYLLEKQVFNRLLEEHANFLLYFTTGPSKGFKAIMPGLDLERCIGEGPLQSESLLFTVRVREIMKSQVITCTETTTVREAAQLMTARDIGSMIVVDRGGSPVGILTDGDLRRKVLATGGSPDLSVAKVMNNPLLTLGPETFCFDALMTMIRHRVKYLVVLGEGKMLGVLSERDIVVAQGNNPVSIIRQIYQAPDIVTLAQLRRDINKTLTVLVDRGGQAREVSQLITQLNDHLAIRVIQLAEQSLLAQGYGLPPTPYAWMALGSEGRQEQTLCTDQDNALIYPDVDEKQSAAVNDYFLTLAGQVVSGLERCGFPPCSGGIMASNPQWCLPLSGWTKLYRRWILDSAMTNQELLISSIFFDYRAIHGDVSLVRQMGVAISQFLPKNKGFLRQLAQRSLELHTPLSFFNRLVVQKSGVHKNKLNIKLYGLMPLVDAVRVLALEQGVVATNTLERIDALIDRDILPNSEGHDLKEAFNLLLLLQLRNHLTQLGEGRELDNYLNPSELSLIQRSVLKTAFKAIEQLQSRIEIRYGLSSLGTR